MGCMKPLNSMLFHSRRVLFVCNPVFKYINKSWEITPTFPISALHFHMHSPACAHAPVNRRTFAKS